MKLNTLLAVVAWLPLIGVWWYARRNRTIHPGIAALHGSVSGLWVALIFLILDLYLRSL